MSSSTIGVNSLVPESDRVETDVSEDLPAVVTLGGGGRRSSSFHTS